MDTNTAEPGGEAGTEQASRLKFGDIHSSGAGRWFAALPRWENLPGDIEERAEIARAAVEELTRFAVAYSDGCFFAAQGHTNAQVIVTQYGLYGPYSLLLVLRTLNPGVVDMCLILFNR